MKKSFNKPAGLLSWLMALSLVFTAVPAAPVFAEESVPAEEYAEDYSDEYVEEGPSVFVITDFPKLKKDDDGKFVDENIQKEFGDLTALPGTPLDLLGLPDDVQVVGYLEADGPDALQEPFDLKDMVWKLKSDTDEVYSETSPAGEYKFIPDLEKYTEEQMEEGTALYDEIKLEKDLKAPVIKVTVAEEETEPMETEPLETEPLETEPLADPNAAGDEWTDGSIEGDEWTDGSIVGDGTWMDDNVVDDGSDNGNEWTDDGTVDDGSDNGDEWTDDGTVDDGSDNGDEWTDDGVVDDGSDNGDEWTDDGVVDDGSANGDEWTDDGTVGDENGDTTPATEGDIFSDLDDSLIGADNGDVWFSDDPQDDGSTDYNTDDDSVDYNTDDGSADSTGDVNVGINEQPIDENPALAQGPGPVVIDQGDGSTNTPDVIDDGSGEGNDGGDGNNGEPTANETRTVSVLITLTDTNGLTVTLPADPSDLENAPELTSGQTTALSITIPCEKNGFNLTGVTVSAADVQGTTTISVTTIDEQGVQLTLDPATVDFENGVAKEITFTSNEVDANGENYTFPVNLTVTKQQHTPGPDATCTEPQICTVCQTVLNPALGHTPGSEATCTEPQICTVCQTVLNPALGHTPGSEATCTEPQICTVCHEVIKPALGHTPGPEATCTEPQICTACNEVLKPALGHTPGPEATCTEPQICTVCNTIIKPALGHTKGDPATCTEPQVCTVCDAVLAPALGHDYAPATCEEPKTCKRCDATKGKPLGHELEDDWEIVKESTDTEHGTEIRYCQRDDCDYSEERALNITGKPENNGISGITAGANYNLNTLISFTAYGSGMGNQDPIDGDVRYVPLSWAVQTTPGAFKDNYSGGFSVTQSGTYTLSVTYQQQKYQGSWQSTNETDTKTVTFTVGNVISATPTEGIRINPQTGDNTPILGFVAALVAAAVLIVAMLLYKKRRRS